MKPEERDFLDYLADILDAMEKVGRFTQGITFEEFSADDRTNFAVVRALEIIGEATKNIPTQIREKYPEVPWKHMAATRDKIIHEYIGVDLAIVWKTVKEEVPAVRPVIEKVLQELYSKEAEPNGE